MDRTHLQRTLVLLKPDAVQRGVCGEIIHRFERVGLNIVGLKMAWADKAFAEKHYFDVKERHGQKILDNLTEYLIMGPVIAIVLEGVDSVAIVRKMAGTTFPFDSAPGTIRGDFAHISKDYANKHERNVANLIHASAKPEEAEYEINHWFEKKELHSYERLDDKHTF